jgi:signal transduction histidine kinase
VVPHAAWRVDNAVDSGLDDGVSRSDERADAAAARSRVAAEQLLLLDRVAPVFGVNVMNSGIVAIVLWNKVPLALLLGWLALTAAVAAFRYHLVRRWRDQGGAVAVERRLREHVVGAAMAGSLWGAICIATALYDHAFGDLVFLSFCVAGMTAGAMTSLAPLRSASTAYLATATGGLAIASSIGPGQWGVWMSLLLVCYIGAMSFLARNFNRAVVSTLELRVENEILAERLKSADAATATALRSKWETIAHLSHELRTPLNAVLGFSDLMKQQIFGPLGSERYVDYAGHVHDGGQRALGLIETILSVAHAESGRLTLDEGRVDLAALVETCLAELAPIAATRRIAITKSLADLPVMRADATKLGQAISNLLSNALNYTPAGGAISVSGAHDDASDHCRIVISDTGIGMARTDIPRALQPFVRLASALTHTVDGAGLGLPLAKRLIELHGGTLAIDSEPGVGTTVTVTLPGARRIAEQATPAHAACEVASAA